MFPHPKLRRFSALLFLTFAARGLTLPFINLYLVSEGFSGTEIGVLISISALVQLTLSPILNALADRAGRHRKLLYGLVVGTAVSSLGLVAPVHKLWLGGAVLLRDNSDKPSATLMSQLVITWLDQNGRDIYGRLRAWGSFGWGVTTLISGRIFAAGGYSLLFVLAGLINLMTLPLLRVLPPRTGTRQAEAGESAPRQSGFYFLMVSLFLFYIGMSAFTAFIFVYLREDLDVSNATIGVAASVAALAEIPPMILIDLLLRRTNPRATLILGFVGMGASWLSFALLTDTVWVLPLMAARGTVYTLQTVSMTLLVARISHPSNVATNQALTHVTIPGLAVLLSGSASGWIYDHAGGRVLFILCTLLALIGAMLLVVIQSKLVKPQVEVLPVTTDA